MTAQPWKYGVRGDGSIWMSFGEPLKGEHHQFDFGGSEDDAKLVCAAPDMFQAILDLDTALCDGFDTQERRQFSRKALISARAAVKKARGQK